MKKKQKKLDAQQLLIKTLIKKNGGASYVAQKLAEIIKKSFLKQGVDYWVKKGGIPLKHVYLVAVLFGVDPHALNYTGLHKAGYVTKKTWAQLVAECKLPPVVVEELSKLKAPK